MRKRNIQILFRLDRKESQELDKLVRKSGLTREVLLRSMISGYKLHEKPDEEFYKVMRELSAIGNRVNQLAAKANALGFVDAPLLQQEVDKWLKFRQSISELYLLPTKGN